VSHTTYYFNNSESLSIYFLVESIGNCHVSLYAICKLFLKKSNSYEWMYTLYLTFYMYTFSKILYIYWLWLRNSDHLFTLIYSHFVVNNGSFFFVTIFKSKRLLVIHYMVLYDISLQLFFCFSFFFNELTYVNIFFRHHKIITIQEIL